MGTVVEQDGREYIRIRDWTWGCIALRDQDIRELYTLLPMGTRVKIEP